jgi:uncharacterized repeat protein (TIGR01451 family)
LTGGVAGEVSLFQNLNNNAQTDIATTVITMPGGLPGMQFSLFDVDFGSGSYTDRITVTGSYNGTTIIPILTNGVSNYVTGNTAIGDAPAADATADGNVVVTFNAPVDTVTVVYGNHTNAPANPGNQWVGLSDLRFCNSYTALSVAKTSMVQADGISGSNPKSVPGATVRYCITVTNSGSSTATNVVAADPLPTGMTYVANSIKSGTSCATSTTTEDDNSSGVDETDPFGAAVSGSTVTGTAATIGPNSSYAFILLATID